MVAKSEQENTVGSHTSHHMVLPGSDTPLSLAKLSHMTASNFKDTEYNTYLSEERKASSTGKQHLHLLHDPKFVG